MANRFNKFHFLNAEVGELKAEEQERLMASQSPSRNPRFSPQRSLRFQIL